MIFKNLMLQALGTLWFRFLQKNSKKKFHACVPLMIEVKINLFFSREGSILRVKGAKAHLMGNFHAR